MVDSCKVFLQSLQSVEYDDYPLLGALDNLESMIRKRRSMGRGRYKIILGFTSNMVSCGLREQIRYMVQNHLIDVLVTTAGGIEEDIIKCVGGKTFLGSFQTSGKQLRSSGLNRVGNLLIPNSNYANFEDFITPIFEKIAAQETAYTPSELISLLGNEVRSEESIYSHCHRGSIPVFCPALTDGSIGDMMFFYNFNKKKFAIDVLRDVEALNKIIEECNEVGIILLGAGLPKHHILRACRMSKKQAESIVQISTNDLVSTVLDSGDSQGISPTAQITTIKADATIVFPLLVSAVKESESKL